jgi:hypothetical protein
MRAGDLNAPEAWALVEDPKTQTAAQVVDPSGELMSDLRRATAEAVANAAGRRLEPRSRPA